MSLYRYHRVTEMAHPSSGGGRRENGGHALVEVLVASILLAMAAGYIASGMINTKRIFKTSTYQYVALGLARDIIEFGASTNFGHSFRFRYYYPPATRCTDCGDPTFCAVDGINPNEGYNLKEWVCFWVANPSDPLHTANTNPFQDLGDIKARNLVPKGSPNSVYIIYETAPDPNFYNRFRHHVSISWEEEGTRHTRDLSTISMTQNNDQLHLELSDFSWRQQ